jgi:hypothetical protein
MRGYVIVERSVFLNQFGGRVLEQGLLPLLTVIRIVSWARLHQQCWSGHYRRSARLLHDSLSLFAINILLLNPSIRRPKANVQWRIRLPL